MTKCKICKKELDQKDKPETEDCGGDCLLCMANIAEDPDCIQAIINLRLVNLLDGDVLRRFRVTKEEIEFS